MHDESYVAVFGILPDAATDEHDRIQVHLSYAEHLLRTVDAPKLSNSQRSNRITLLEFLNQYWTAGIFPTNKDYPGERKPCFIDADGKLCAVGYLIEKTKGRELAEDINEKHRYDFLEDMKEPVIEAWANEFGLTLEECVMIQPTYGPPPSSQTNYADIKTGYGIFSGLIGGSNIAINMANLSHRFKNNTKLSYIGLAAGHGAGNYGHSQCKKDKHAAANKRGRNLYFL